LVILTHKVDSLAQGHMAASTVRMEAKG
jgi:hypothetical protein